MKVYIFLTSTFILYYLKMQVLTFDNRGVSGHQNHISTNSGVLYSINKLKRDAPEQYNSVKLYMLVSKNQTFLKSRLDKLNVLLFLTK